MVDNSKLESSKKTKNKVTKFATSSNFLIAIMFCLSFTCGGAVSYAIFGRKDPVIIHECPNPETTTKISSTSTIDYSDMKLLNLPIKRIIVGQTSESCHTTNECVQIIQQIRDENPDMKDIPWNFLIGGDGKVYEGRGYRYEGEHTMNINSSNYNEIGIGVAFLGNYRNIKPSSEMVEAFKLFINELINEGVIEDEYHIFFQDDLIYKEHEAIELKNALKELENFYGLQKIYTRKSWNALDTKGMLENVENPLNRTIIHHTATPNYACFDFENCTLAMLSIQKSMSNEYSDIYYNFVIGGVDNFSMVMEGRGFSKLGAHTKDNNKGSLGIAFIGNFDQIEPGPAIIDALRKFLADALILGKLTDNYELIARHDIDKWGSPGKNIINIIRTWDHYGTPIDD